MKQLNETTNVNIEESFDVSTGHHSVIQKAMLLRTMSMRYNCGITKVTLKYLKVPAHIQLTVIN